MSRPSFVRSFMDLSTAHLDKETRAFLKPLEDRPEGNDAGTEFGWWLYVPAEEDPEGTPAVLAEIFKLAREYECPYVLLDADAEEIDALPTFDFDGEGETE